MPQHYAPEFASVARKNESGSRALCEFGRIRRLRMQTVNHPIRIINDGHHAKAWDRGYGAKS
jgi:hypothetical protein